MTSLASPALPDGNLPRGSRPPAEHLPGPPLRVAFAEAPEPYFGRAGEAPLRLATAAAAVRAAGHAVTLEDGGVHPAYEAWRDACLASAPDVLFIHGDTKHVSLAARLARDVRTSLPVAVTILWGNHTDALDCETLDALPQLDAVLRHDPEDTLVQACRAVSAGRAAGTFDFAGIRGLTWRSRAQHGAAAGAVTREPDAPRVRLDDIPLPARDLLRSEAYSDFRGPVLGQLFSARGCAYRCTFCEEADTPLSLRAAARVVDEMESLHQEHGITRFTFRDPLFGPRRHLLATCREIEARLPGVSFYCLTHPGQIDEETAAALARAGAWCVDMGVESGDPQVLASYGKGTTLESVRRAVALLKSQRIKVQLNLVLGGPLDTPETIRASVEFFLSLQPDHHCVTLAQPVPGSPLYKELLATHRLRQPQCWDDYYTNPFYTLTNGHAEWSQPPRLDRMIHMSAPVVSELERAYRRLGRRMLSVRIASAARALVDGSLLRRPGGPARLLRDAARAARFALR